MLANQIQGEVSLLAENVSDINVRTMLRELAMAQAAPCSMLRVLRLPTQVRSSPVLVLLGASGVCVHLLRRKGGPPQANRFCDRAAARSSFTTVPVWSLLGSALCY